MLKWPPDQAMRTDVNLILMALDAHWQMVKAIFGSGEKDPEERKPMTAERWQAFSKGHNARYHRQGRTRPRPPGAVKGGASGR